MSTCWIYPGVTLNDETYLLRWVRLVFFIPTGKQDIFDGIPWDLKLTAKKEEHHG